MRLVASMIVRDELGRYLRESVEHLLDFCDEVRVLDDGSTDGTASWLRGVAGVSLLESFDSRFFQHEGRARQRLLRWTLDADPTHVLAVDADEFVADGAAVRAACERDDRQAWTLNMREVWELDGDCICVRQDGGWREHPVPVLWRVPPYPAAASLQIADRALACGREPTAIRHLAQGPPVSDLLHLGWANEREREDRHRRYAVADGGRYHASRHLDSILWPADRVTLEGTPWPDGLARWRPRIARNAGWPAAAQVS